ncbi:2OG-Fe(II) oxygenase [Brevundimonas albigilva]|uniref:prolyl hydroxylase family protein n=1 Tax=Brevundimonas albigilva TaxID=1312364 RepID=UPI00201B63CA|nr:2OG-Fe(II) oxygenase [Brevundimonas albigilva]UQV19357.1 2OG-Fe(II) oxygenase [Brevundimonas albigilva]
MTAPVTEPLDPLALHARARDGDVKAQIALSAIFDREGRHDVALGWLQQAAAGGSLEAETALGSRLLVGRAAPFAPAQGAERIHRAAEMGGVEAAMRAAVLLLRGLGRPPSGDAALDLLLSAALKDNVDASAQLAVLANDEDLLARVDRGAPLSEDRLKRARRAIDLPAWLGPPTPAEISETPRIRIFSDFLPPLACLWIRRRADRKLDVLRVYDAEAGGVRTDGIRTSRGAGFGLLDTDVVLTLVAARMAVASGLRLETFEPANVLNYQVGQQYRLHYDYLDPAAPALAEALHRQGQRTATFLAYLNDGYAGGETAFPRLEWDFKAKAGDALLFFNVDLDGRPVERSLHAGLPPTDGEKWVLSQWIRDRAQPLI